ncbi:MAG: hypothetical protein JSW06_11355 [Thermoplasmatales archaeon]|nr:MAG: hypothetical protein JSW06_11355 [Thermoplasmatales archaeon]
MNNEGATGITTVILLVSFLLIGATTASVLTGNSNNISEQDLEEMVDNIVDEISTYIQIKDVMGKFYFTGGEPQIQKIAVLIKPLFSIDMNVSEIMIKLCNGEQIKMLYYGGQAEFFHSNSLFEHPIWDNNRDNNFNFIVTLDKDRSLVNYNTINENTDMAYITIKLSEDFTMTKGDTMTITYFLSKGATRTITVEAPLPTKQIVTLG